MEVIDPTLAPPRPAGATGAPLNPHHTHYVLVDAGVDGVKAWGGGQGRGGGRRWVGKWRAGGGWEGGWRVDGRGRVGGVARVWVQGFCCGVSAP